MPRLSRHLNERRTYFGVIERDFYIAGGMFVSAMLVLSDSEYEVAVFAVPAIYLLLRATVFSSKKPTYLEDIIPSLIKGRRGYVCSSKSIKNR